MKRYYWSAGILFSMLAHALFFVYLLSDEIESVSGGVPSGEGGIVVACAYSSGESDHGEMDEKATEQTKQKTPAPIQPPVSEPVNTPPDSPQIQIPEEIKLEKKEEIEPQPVRRKKPRKIKEKKSEKQKPRNKQTKPAQTATGEGSSGRRSPSESPGASALGSSGSLQGIGDYRQGIRNYQALLQAWLEKHKRYPKRAMRRRIEGKGILYFRLDRNGNVLAGELRTRTGSGILDREILATLKRASPLPPVPDSVSGSALEFTIPVEFSLR